MVWSWVRDDVEAVDTGVEVVAGGLEEYWLMRDLANFSRCLPISASRKK